ncbi:diguanylate cyclase [Alishewanella sp. 16-MA]|uniref:diguanylate cyclase n=1 Tax=Alishewanella maricola TaxID=2795740 RepID=A0ABS8BZL0_9ALTE|nr:diguanylate cyclase [Alishewanella sp. SMS8]MCB5225492.1 diguanylate cyclase [Alishewanella maricola]MDP4945705.1 diguanylate cyclase [Alishewanella sp.]MDP5035118.1 diguanylate cyclase [Alishewanella sp.]MDP5188040.1 diguanylate cyclase [Alishewanella sp.]MDP5458618.1 diguanylate cyclase [Alishewanella sp. SMS8]
MISSILVSMVQHLPGGVLLLNSHCQISYANSFIYRYSELTERELVGKSFFSLFPEVPKAWFNRKMQSVLTSQQTEQISWQQRLYLLKFPRQQHLDQTQVYMAQNCTLIALRHPQTHEQFLCLWIQDASEQARYHAKLLMTQQQLKIHDRQDSLTGLMNRQFWQQQLLLEIARAERYERPLSLMMFDIDQFKHLNDQYGHKAADILLQSLARHCAGLLRDNDLLARFGGASFAVVLPDTTLNGAIEVANRVRLQLSEQAFIEHEPKVRVTISAGVSLHQMSNSADELILQADQALYQAKRAGRNQVSIWNTAAIAS